MKRTTPALTAMDSSNPLTEAAAEDPPRALISVQDLRTWFPVRRGIWARTVGHIKAVDGVSFQIPPQSTFGLVGESGSGKTTVGRAILRLDPMVGGTIQFRNRTISDLPAHRLRPLRRHLQMIFQDPFSSLNPRLSVLEILTEGPAMIGLVPDTADALAAHWLSEVGLSPDMMNRYPHEFSGGQRQRICIARAMAMEPEFIVCDEAVSALDVTVQAQIIDLLMRLQEKYQLSYLFISHDLSVVKRIADHVAVMQAGRIVERGTATDVIDDPQTEYTRALIAAVPVPGDPTRRRR